MAWEAPLKVPLLAVRGHYTLIYTHLFKELISSVA